MAEIPFARRISQIRRRFFIRAGLRLLLDGFLFSLILPAVLSLLEYFGVLDAGPGLIWTSTAAGFFLGAVVSLWGKRSGFMGWLVELEARLDIKEILSTAYEYYRLRRESLYLGRLYEEAEDLVASLDSDRLLPSLLRPVYTFIPVLLILILTVPVFEVSRSLRGDLEREKISLIKKAFEASIGRSDTQGSAVSGPPGLEDDVSGRPPKRSPVFGRDFQDSLRELEKRVRAERTGAARRLAEGLTLGDVSSLPAFKPLLDESEINPDDFEQMRRELDRMFQGEPPESLKESLADLEEKIRFEQFLREAMDEREDSPSSEEGITAVVEESQEPLSEESQDGQNALMTEDPERSLTDRRDGRDDGETPDDDGRTMVMANEPGSPLSGRRKVYDEGDEWGRDAEGEIETYSAGQELDSNKEGKPGDIEPSQMPPLDDGAESGPGDDRYSLIRTLPTSGGAERSEAEVVRTYRREVESVLAREDIPLLYRQYIKKYFLLIGLKRALPATK